MNLRAFRSPPHPPRCATDELRETWVKYHDHLEDIGWAYTSSGCASDLADVALDVDILNKVHRDDIVVSRLKTTQRQPLSLRLKCPILQE